MKVKSFITTHFVCPAFEGASFMCRMKTWQRKHSNSVNGQQHSYLRSYLFSLSWFIYAGFPFERTCFSLSLCLCRNWLPHPTPRLAFSWKPAIIGCVNQKRLFCILLILFQVLLCARRDSSPGVVQVLIPTLPHLTVAWSKSLQLPSSGALKKRRSV